MIQIEGKEARGVYFFTLFQMLPLWLLVGPIIAATLGLLLQSWGVFYFVLIGFPIVTTYLKASRRIERFNEANKEMVRAVKEKLQQADYYNSGAHGAIAVDAGRKEIAVVSADKKFNVKEPFIFGVEKIRSFQPYAPGYRVLETIGSSDMATDYDVANKNMAAKAEANWNTGLYIELDDLSKPEVFAQMEHSDAKKWRLLIEKLRLDELERQPEPKRYPPVD